MFFVYKSYLYPGTETLFPKSPLYVHIIGVLIVALYSATMIFSPPATVAAVFIPFGFHQLKVYLQSLVTI